MSKYFVFTRINGERQAGLMQKYGGQGFPALRFLNSSGQQVHGFDGYVPVDQFVQEMETARKMAGN